MSLFDFQKIWNQTKPNILKKEKKYYFKYDETDTLKYGQNYFERKNLNLKQQCAKKVYFTSNKSRTVNGFLKTTLKAPLRCIQHTT